MTWPTSASIDSPAAVAALLDGAIRSMLATLAPWRASVAATSQIRASDAISAYSSVTATRRLMNDKKGTPGLAAAYRTLLSTAAPTFDPVGEYPAVKTAMDAFVTWFQGSWPRTTTGLFTGAFGILTPDAVTGELTDFTVALTSGQRTTALANIDALIAAFG